MEEDNNIIGKVAYNLSSRYLSLRLRAIKESCVAFENAAALGTKPGPLKKLFKIILNSFLSQYFDEKPWKASFIDFFQLCNIVELPFNIYELIEEVISDLVNIPIPISINPIPTIQLCIIFLEKFNPTTEEESLTFPSWCHSLILSLGLVINSIFTQPENNQIIVDRVKYLLETHLRKTSSISVEKYLEIIGDSSILNVPFTLLLLSEILVKIDQNKYLSNISTIRVDLFNKQILQSKTAVSENTLHNFKSYLADITQNEWTTSIEVALIKTLKKSPESASYLVAWVAEFINDDIDLSLLVTEAAASSCVRMLKSATDAVRESGIRLVRYTSLKTKNLTAIQTFSKSLMECLQGKGGVLSQIQQRQAFLLALGHVAENISNRSDRIELSTTVNTTTLSLITTVEKEGDESTRLIGFQCISKWLIYYAATPPQPLPAELADGLRQGVLKPKGLSTCYLLALVELLQYHDTTTTDATAAAAAPHHGVLSSFLPLLPQLATLVKEAIKKPLLVHLDATLALSILIDLSLTLQAAAETLDSIKLWTSLTSSSASFLGSRLLLHQVFPSSPSSSASSDTNQGFKYLYRRVCLSLCRTLCITGRAYSAKCKLFDIQEAEAASPVSTLTSTGTTTDSSATGTGIRFAIDRLPVSSTTGLIFSILHRDRVVRLDACQLVASLCAASTTASPCLMRLLLSLIETLSREKDRRAKVETSTNTASPEEGFERVSENNGLWLPPPSHISEALVSLLKLSPKLRNYSDEDSSGTSTSKARFHTLLTAVMIAAHPMTSPSLKRCLQFAKIIIAAFGSREVITTILSDNWEEVCSSLVTKITEGGASLQARVAAQQSIYLIFRVTVAISAATSSAHISIHQRIIRTLLDMIATLDYKSIPEQDLQLYLNPNLGSEVEVSKKESSVDIRITNADRKKSSARSSRKGTFGADVVEDEDWAEQIKKEKAKRMGVVVEAEGDIGERRKLIVEETINRVRSIVLVFESVLQTLEALWKHCEGVSGAFAGEIVPCVISLMNCPALVAAAFQCVATFCRSVEKEIRHIGSDLSYALRTVVTVMTRPLSKSESQADRHKHMLAVSGPVIRCIKLLQATVIREVRLSVTSLQLVLPLVFGVLDQPVLLVGCESAFMVLDGCWPNLEDAENKGKKAIIAYCRETLDILKPMRKTVIEICLKVFSRFRVTPPADKVLIRVTSQQDLSPGDWTPLLGQIGMLSMDVHVRSACLRAVMVMALRGANLRSNPLLESRLWICRFDSEEGVRQVATSVWNERAAPLTLGYLSALLPLLSHDHPHVRDGAAKAIAGGLLEHPSTVLDCVEKMKSTFMNALPPPPAAAASPVQPDSTSSMMSMPLRLPSSQQLEGEEDKKWSSRVAVAVFISTMGGLRAIPEDLVAGVAAALLDFVLAEGVVDRQAEVREAMLAAGRSLLDNYGDVTSEVALATLQSTLAKRPGRDEDIARFDFRNEAAVVLLGAAGKHLSKDDPNIISITRTLVQALDTPSETVQRSVADCLGPLVQSQKATELVKDLLEGLIVKAINGETYGQRRGAAFGISAFVKGIGLPSLKQFDIVTRLKDACTSGTVNNKQGALFAFELLSDRLGLLFEPYIITIIPILLKSFSHSSDHVREAAQVTAKVIMGRLSAHGVKQVLNPILTSLAEESAWKSRQEAIRLLGSMANCAPKQLASCLSQIVPRLVEAGSDPHPKVKESAKLAMNDISAVIKNPEISKLSPILLAALGDPSNKTKEALEALLVCEFMHSIDAPSLAILVPIIARALRDRGADLKRKASTIMGNICSMITDPKMLVPYLQQVLPGLKDALVDPIPDVRANSAKALGSLMTGVGEEELQDLLPWLMLTLQTDLSPVERSGAAQGLAEVCLSLGTQRLRSILSQVLDLQSHAKSSAREGMQWLLSFLPAAMGENFSDHIAECLPVILLGLSDDSEGVREVALRGGQVMVSVYGIHHTLELLPSLISGMFQEDWRIRQSSVTLLGELLYLVGDAKAVGLADVENEDDDGGGQSGAGNSSRVAITIRAHIGDEHTDAVLASLYIVRSDSSMSVRQVALQVWKSVVSNTPRTLREIMPVLVSQLIEKLSSESFELRSVTGKALGEVIRKLGDHVLPEIIPHLKEGLGSREEAVRQGVCLGLAEILNAASTRQIETYIDTLVPALILALCDRSVEVREGAARGFVTLFKAISIRAVEAIVPPLLAKIVGDEEEGDNNSGILGLKAVVKAKQRDLVEYLIPILMVSPIRIPYAKVLGMVASVAGQSLNYHFSFLIPRFVDELMLITNQLTSASTSTSPDAASASELKERLEAVKVSAGTVMGAVASSGVTYLVTELGAEIEHDTSVQRRMWGCWLTGQFCGKSSADYSEYVPVILKYVLSRVTEMDPAVLRAVAEALSALNESVGSEALLIHLEFIRSCINSTASDSKHRTGMGILRGAGGEFLLPLLTLPSSLDALFPMFIYGLMNGNASQRENAAAGIGELAAMADATVLKPYLIKTAGPLIRVAGDRFPSNVKLAIIETLVILLSKGAASLKAFVPQLQTTFIKSLNDPSKQVRCKAASALGQLMTLSTRIDPILLELSTSVTQAESVAIRCSVLEAISQVLYKGGDKATPVGLDRCKEAVLQGTVDDEENVRQAAAHCTGGLVAYYSEMKVTDLLLDVTSTGKSSQDAASASGLAGKALAAGWALSTGGDKTLDVRGDIFAVIRAALEEERGSTKVSGLKALAAALAPPQLVGREAGTAAGDALRGEHSSMALGVLGEFTGCLRSCLRDASGDVRRAAALVVKEAAKHHAKCRAELSRATMQALITCVTDININVKVIAERAMKHLLEIGTDPSGTLMAAGSAVAAGGNTSQTAIAKFLTSCDVDTARFVKDYAKRILSRLAEESDED